MPNLFRLPSGNVLENTLGDLVAPDLVVRLTEYGGGDYTEESLRHRLQQSFGREQGNSLLPQILALSQVVPPPT